MVLALEQVLQALESGALVLTANNRVARALAHSHAARQQRAGREAWVSPDVLPWMAWVGRCWDELLFGGLVAPKVRLSAHQQRSVWEEIIAGSPEGDSLLQPAPAARRAMAAWDLLKSWRVPFPDSSWEAGADVEAFVRWACQFRSRCAAAGWVEDSALADVLIAELPKRAVRLPERVLLIGFEEFTPQQAGLWQALREAGSEVDDVVFPAQPGRQNALHAAFPSFEEEIRAAARWSRRLLEEETPGTIGIIVPDLARRRREVERIVEDILDPGAVLPDGPSASPVFNISFGLPLAEYPLVHTALLIIRAVDDRIALSDVAGLLRSPFIQGYAGELAARARLEAWLASRGGVEIRAEALRVLAENRGCLEFSLVLRAWQETLAAAPLFQGPSAWARIFSELLRAAGWPGERVLNSAEYQTLDEWGSLLSHFAALDLTCSPMSRGQAAERLQQMAAETLFQPGQQELPVQILGLLETSGMQFEHLWITGMHHEAWPAAPRPNPLLPLAVQRRYGLPHASAERELAFAQLLTSRLLDSAPEVIFSYPRRGDEDRDLLPSPLVSSFAEMPPERLPLSAIVPFSASLRGAATLEQINDETAPPLTAGLWSRGGAKLIQLQAACPFRAFAELRLNAEALEAPEAGLNPRQRGILLHVALEQLWRTLGSHAALCEGASEEIARVIRDAVSAAISQKCARMEVPAWHLALERARLEQILRDWLELEKQRAPFVVGTPEQERIVELGGMQLRLKVDRVDRLPDGREIILDYKSGEPNTQAWSGERPDEPQLPLYCITHGSELAAVAFAQLKRGALQFKGIASGDDVAAMLRGAKPAGSMTDQIREWRTVLERLAEEFRQGSAAVNPKAAKTCSTCRLAALCRIREREEQWSQ